MVPILAGYAAVIAAFGWYGLAAVAVHVLLLVAAARRG